HSAKLVVAPPKTSKPHSMQHTPPPKPGIHPRPPNAGHYYKPSPTEWKKTSKRSQLPKPRITAKQSVKLTTLIFHWPLTTYAILPGRFAPKKAPYPRSTKIRWPTTTTNRSESLGKSSRGTSQF